ncbi:MAG: DUF433 domain-containing protein [Candidatus Aerophobetes bacterium]|nr:DUF433 domain-containing protein [Candidatus Aerophobetes bacterium]
MSEDLLERIEINPKVMLGKPVIRGTRIPVEIILKKLSQNISVEEILQDYPRLTRKDIQAALKYAAESVSAEEVHLLKIVNP